MVSRFRRRELIPATDERAVRDGPQPINRARTADVFHIVKQCGLEFRGMPKSTIGWFSRALI
jgi:hypothetical protein